MNKKIKTEAVDHLFDAILTLETPEECYKFFEDVCTINELLSLSQRYEVARDASGRENLSGDCGEDRGFHRHYQPREPFSKLWKRRVRYGICQAESGAGI